MVNLSWHLEVGNDNNNNKNNNNNSNQEIKVYKQTNKNINRRVFSPKIAVGTNGSAITPKPVQEVNKEERIWQ